MQVGLTAAMAASILFTTVVSRLPSDPEGTLATRPPAAADLCRVSANPQQVGSFLDQLFRSLSGVALFGDRLDFRADKSSRRP
jgi:hypothetical protein